MTHQRTTSCSGSGVKSRREETYKKIKVDLVKKSLLQIPIDQYRLLKKFCAVNDLKVSEFILLAIKEKLER